MAGENEQSDQTGLRRPPPPHRHSVRRLQHVQGICQQTVPERLRHPPWTGPLFRHPLASPSASTRLEHVSSTQSRLHDIPAHGSPSLPKMRCSGSESCHTHQVLHAFMLEVGSRNTSCVRALGFSGEDMQQRRSIVETRVVAFLLIRPGLQPVNFDHGWGATWCAACVCARTML